MVDSCRTCDFCRADREQNCAQTATFTYNSPDKHGAGPTTYGGYSDKIVVTEHFVIRIPPGVDDGTQLRVSGDGNDAGAGSVPGDLVVRVRVLPPPRDPRAVRYIAFALLLVALLALALYVIH